MNGGWHAKIKKLMTFFSKNAVWHASRHLFVFMPINKK
jgi:hypothetical protein